MNDTAKRKGLWIAGAIFIVAGLVYSSLTVDYMEQYKERMERKQADIRQLQAMQNKIEKCIDARKKYEALDLKKPVDINGMIAQAGLSQKLADSRETTNTIADGWVRLQKEVIFNEINIKEALEIASRMESTKPPWCVQKITVRSSIRDNGFGQVVLSLEALQKE